MSEAQDGFGDAVSGPDGSSDANGASEMVDRCGHYEAIWPSHWQGRDRDVE